MVKDMYPVDAPCHKCVKHVCETCVLAKQRRKSFREANEDVLVEGPLDLLHMDTVGVINPESHEGGKIILNVVDAYSGMVIAV
jgi:predicted NUDIX family phosphoesterase